MMTILFKKDIFDILTLFSMSPGSRFSRKELKEKTKLNNVNLDNAINSLINASIIRKEKRLFSLDLEKSRDLIKLVSEDYKSLHKIPLNVYYAITGLLSFMGKLKNIDVYLFGSYAKLVFKDTSDIDIAVISDVITRKEKNNIGKIIQKAEEKYGKRLEIHYFGSRFYKSKKDPLVKEVLKNGIKIL